MVYDEYEKHKDLYDEYWGRLMDEKGDLFISRARRDMRVVKDEDKFFFTPRFLPMSLVTGHIERCENTFRVLNQILKENREGEKTPLSDIIPRKRQYNVPMSNMYERAIELVDPRFPSIFEGRIDGCIAGDSSLVSYEINANRAGWENSRAFCDIYNTYFSSLLPGYTIDYADGWEKIIKYALRKINGKKVVYLTEQTGKESVDALKARGIDIEFLRFQDLESMMKSGEVSITKDDFCYRGEKIDLVCRFLRTHQVLEVEELCECAKAGNVHLINQADAFFGGLKTLMIRLLDPDLLSPYARPEDIINIPVSSFLRDVETNPVVEKKGEYVLKFGNRGGGKAVHFGIDLPGDEWRELLESSRRRFPETAMVQEYVEPSVSPVFDGGGVSLLNTTCDVFVFTTEKPSFGGVFSRCSHDNLVNFKTGGIKQTVFI